MPLEPVENCFMKNENGNICTLKKGHKGLHSCTISWFETQIDDPINHTSIDGKFIEELEKAVWYLKCRIENAKRNS